MCSYSVEIASNPETRVQTIGTPNWSRLTNWKLTMPMARLLNLFVIRTYIAGHYLWQIIKCCTNAVRASKEKPNATLPSHLSTERGVIWPIDVDILVFLPSHRRAAKKVIKKISIYFQKVHRIEGLDYLMLMSTSNKIHKQLNLIHVWYGKSKLCCLPWRRFRPFFKQCDWEL